MDERKPKNPLAVKVNEGYGFASMGLVVSFNGIYLCKRIIKCAKFNFLVISVSSLAKFYENRNSNFRARIEYGRDYEGGSGWGDS